MNQKRRQKMKGLIRDAAIYFGLGLGCVIGADYVVAQTWHDVLLIISGVFLGGVAAMMTMIEIKLKARRRYQESHGGLINDKG